MITPKNFERLMKELFEKNKGYQEMAHKDMDALMCRVLKELGYRDGVKIFLRTEKWYQ